MSNKKGNKYIRINLYLFQESKIGITLENHLICFITLTD